VVRIEDVFGVSNKQVRSYIQRDHVDDKFIEAYDTPHISDHRLR
jgi:hypothetical protein